MDAYVDQIESIREPDGLWHPSSISSPCDRKSIYEYRGAEKEPLTARTKRIFRVGHILHEFIQTAIEADPSVRGFWPEVPIVAGPLMVTGHADGLLEHESGEYEVLEFKTIKSTAFRYNDLPKADHILQVSLYLKVLREYGTVLPSVTLPPLGDMLRRARVVYVSKDDLQIGEYPILWSEARNRQIEDKLVVLNAHRLEGTLPDRLPASGAKRHYLCGYCPFQTQCWEGD